MDFLNFLIFILFAHWISDFVFQSDKMAINKSKSFYWLTFHVLAYGSGMLFFMLMTMTIFSSSSILLYILINSIAHFCTDAVTSRITSYLYSKGDRHNFFVVIGLDQLIHTATLLWTIPILERMHSIF